MVKKIIGIALFTVLLDAPAWAAPRGFIGDTGSGWSSTSKVSVRVSGEHTDGSRLKEDAINGAGICFQDISVLDAGLDAASDGWETEGFVLIDNRVRQDYIVQVIQMGEANRVDTLVLDDNNTGEMTIAASQDRERLVVAVAALAPKTRVGAAFTLTVEPVG